ncbi:AraC family transcriptional regulator [Massilia sp. CF038]|uniref:AraC family transcriptional regulator n=1 Tax=Massilia sp. CF038 TaxID=1881045 RepID=UPI00091FF3F9|nr:AraC family transcriptional regulator [Massilia sp. CF038]SHG73463.1 transcriptional regulator, AraC family [Massilia sp. CF038]
MNQMDANAQQLARLEQARASLAASVARWAGPDQDPWSGPIPGLKLFQRTAPSEPISCMYDPSVTLIVRGRKRVLLGEDTFLYDAGELLITSVDLPAIGEIIEADPARPFLSLSMRLDQRVMTELIVEGKLRPPRSEPTGRGMTVGQATLPLFQAFQRLLDLLDAPEEIDVLAPLIQREILYRLMVSEQGTRLWQIASLGSQGQRIARAIDWLKAHATEPLRVDELAASVQMSTSTFHHHFRALTAMSPLQFQKWLRLHDARRLMLTEHLDAATAAFRVGYESPSQFGREYHRLFGAPPLRDIASLRRAPAAVHATAPAMSEP